MNTRNLKFNPTKSSRGFDKLTFDDCYDNGCELQESSCMRGNCVWLGLSDSKPRLLTRDAIRLGLITEKEAEKNYLGEPCGWTDYKLPEEVFVPSRMILTQQQAMQLAMKLMEFAYTGKIINQN